MNEEENLNLPVPVNPEPTPRPPTVTVTPEHCIRLGARAQLNYISNMQVPFIFFCTFPFSLFLSFTLRFKALIHLQWYDNSLLAYTYAE